MHESYGKTVSIDVGAAEADLENRNCSQGNAEGNGQLECDRVTVRKLFAAANNVLLRTSAVRVINPRTGKSTLVYARHNTASQVTLISKRLRDELYLEVGGKRGVAIHTLAEQTTPSEGFTEFTIQSLMNNEKFEIKNALIIPEFTDEDSTRPHAVNVASLEHFRGAKIPVISKPKSIDVLIGQSDKSLLTVLDERESLNPDEPNYVLTRFGPTSSGGYVSAGSHLPQSLKVSECLNVCDCQQLKLKNLGLKESLRSYELEDEVIQPSKNDEIVRELVQSWVNVVNDRYEIPVPLKANIVEFLPNNYSCALYRTSSLRRKALSNANLKNLLTDKFEEMISEGWITPVNWYTNDSGCWYLPFFVTKKDKAIVVFDGAATFRGLSLNDAVFSGAKLLNGLIDVRTRFRIGKYACMADLS